MYTSTVLWLRSMVDHGVNRRCGILGRRHLGVRDLQRIVGGHLRDCWSSVILSVDERGWLGTLSGVHQLLFAPVVIPFSFVVAQGIMLAFTFTDFLHGDVAIAGI